MVSEMFPMFQALSEPVSCTDSFNLHNNLGGFRN